MDGSVVRKPITRELDELHLPGSSHELEYKQKNNAIFCRGFGQIRRPELFSFSGMYCNLRP